MRYLRQSTAQTVPVGPFLSKADGVTPITSATLGNSGNKVAVVWKRGVTATVNVHTLTFTHLSAGMYSLAFTSGIPDTLGEMRLYISDTDSHYQVWEDFCVVPANVFDAMVLGSDYLQVDAQAIEDSTGPLAKIADAVLTRPGGSVVGDSAGARTLLNAVRKLVNKTVVSGSTLVVYKEDDATQAWTASLGTSASAEPIVSIDP